MGIVQEEVTVYTNGNSIHNMIPLLKKENVDLYPCPRRHNNYAVAYSNPLGKT